jgi:hypothetical protein
MSKAQRSPGQIKARMSNNNLALTPEIPEPDFTDSQIDCVPLDLKRDCVKWYIVELQKQNKALRQVIVEMDKPLTPKGIRHPAKKGAGL